MVLIACRLAGRGREDRIRMHRRGMLEDDTFTEEAAAAAAAAAATSAAVAPIFKKKKLSPN